MCDVVGEADVVAAHVEELITGGLHPSDIAVIAPYNLQVSTVLGIIFILFLIVAVIFLF